MKDFAKKFKKTVMLFFKLLLLLTAVGIYAGTYKYFYEVPQLP